MAEYAFSKPCLMRCPIIVSSFIDSSSARAEAAEAYPFGGEQT